MDAANYTVRSGSTIVTLKKAYLKTISVGKHEVEMVWKGGSAKTTLTIAAASDVPKTGDSSNMAAWLAILGAAAMVMIMAVRRRRAR